MTAPRSSPSRTTAKSAVRALDVLTLLDSRSEPVTAATIARELRLPRSSMYHLLGVMVERGFVVHHADSGRWALGPVALGVGSGPSRHDALVRLSRPVLRGLLSGPGQSATLAVRYGYDLLVAAVEPSSTDGRGWAPGDRRPAHASALGRALLVQDNEGTLRATFPVEGLPRFVGGPASWAELLVLLATARTRGVAVGEGEPGRGLETVAAPVLDHLGVVVASIGLMRHRGIDQRGASARHRHQVIRAAGALSARLGHGADLTRAGRRIPA